MATFVALVLLVLAITASWAVTLTYLCGLAAGALAVWMNGREEPRLPGPLKSARRVALETTPAASAVLDAAPNPCILIDGRAVIVHANLAARSAFPALATGQPLSFTLRDPVLVAAVGECLRNGGQQDVTLVETLSVERSFVCSVAAIPTGTGRSALIVLRDTSRERAVEAMRVDFIANASHELRTPLASVLGFIETLQGPARNDPAARERFLAIMAEQARRMARLVDDLLSLSRLEMKQHVAPSGAIDLATLLAGVVGSLVHLAEERQVVLTLRKPQEAVIVPGDSDELMSVFDNLIENAIKYGRTGGRVDVTLAVGREAVVHVQDYGPGIAAEHLPRLTERFYRVDNALSRAEGGTGLGLALVKHTLRRHRGSLNIQSKPDEGATFSVTLPLLPA